MERSLASIPPSAGGVLPLICRTCLCETTDRNLFTKDSSNTSLQTMLKAFTGLEISPDDKLPQNICNGCAEVAQAAYSFRTRSLRIDGILRRLVKNMHTIRVYTCTEEETPSQPVAIPVKSTADSPVSSDTELNGRRVHRDGDNAVRSPGVSCCKCSFDSKTVQKKVSSIKHLQKHRKKKRSKSKAKRKAYMCFTCGMMYISQIELLRHRKIHILVKDENDDDSSLSKINKDGDSTQNVVGEPRVEFDISVEKESSGDAHLRLTIDEQLSNNNLKQSPVQGIQVKEENSDEVTDELLRDDEWWFCNEPTQYNSADENWKEPATFTINQKKIDDDLLTCNIANKPPLFDKFSQGFAQKNFKESTTMELDDNQITIMSMRQSKPDPKQHSFIEVQDRVDVKEDKDLGCSLSKITKVSVSDGDSSFHQLERDSTQNILKEQRIVFDIIEITGEPFSNNQSVSGTTFDNNVKQENPNLVHSTFNINDEWSLGESTKRKEAVIDFRNQEKPDDGHQSINVISGASSNNKILLNKSAHRTESNCSNITERPACNDKSKEDAIKMPSASSICIIPQDKVDFRNNRDITIHYTNRHCEGPPPFKCPVCTKVFSTRFQVRRHLRLHLTCLQSLNDKGMLKCPECPKEFSKECYPKIHLKRQSMWNKYMCNVVSVRSKFVVEDHNVSKEMNCIKDKDDEAAKAFNNQLDDGRTIINESQLRLGNSATQEESDNCNLTSKITSAGAPLSDQSKENSSEKDRKEHRRVGFDFTVKKEISDDENPSEPLSDDEKSLDHERSYARYLCAVPQCKKILIHRRELVNHYITEHDMASTLFKCPVCAKTIPKNVRRHLMSHVAVQYICPHCPRICRYLQNLKRHIKTHTGERPLKCPECSKRFRTQSALSDHRKTHSSTNEYECKICRKEFHSRNGMLLHSRSHMEIKELQCKNCNKQFPVKSKLQRHLNTGCRYRKSERSESVVEGDSVSKETNCFTDKEDQFPKTLDNQPVGGQPITKEHRLEVCTSVTQEKSNDQSVFDQPKHDTGLESRKEPVMGLCLWEKEKLDESGLIFSIKNEPLSDDDLSIDQTLPVEFNLTIKEEISDDDNLTLKITNECQTMSKSDHLTLKIFNEYLQKNWKQLSIRSDREKSDDSGLISNIKSEPLSDERSLDQCTQSSSIEVENKSSSVDFDLTCKEEISDDDNTTFETINEPENDASFPCAVPQCKKTFRFRIDIIDHYISQHNMASTPFTCPVCAKVVYKNIQVLKHVKSHIKAKYECPHCTKVCQTRTNLESHIQSHAVQPWKCSRCPKKFQNRSDLYSHLLDHSNDKEYDCDYCKKLFYSRSGLCRHSKICVRREKILNCPPPLRIHLIKALENSEEVKGKGDDAP